MIEEKKNYKKLHYKMQRKNISQNDKIKIEKVNFNNDYNFEDDFEVELKVPIGSFSHNYVLLATVFCYFCTATSIVISLIS